jgi:S1-C subfamily serine protease
MRRWLIAVALSLAACERSSAQGDFASSGAPSPAVQARPASAIFGFWSQAPHPAVVRVISPERNSASLGSGTLVDVSDRHGLVITNWHVVKDAAGNVIVSFPDGFQTPGYVIKTDRDWDLAAVAIWRPKVDPVPIAPAVPARGEPLTIAGYGSGNYRAQTGRCMQYLSPGIGLPYDIVEVSAAARHGDSGGPIFNSRGELAGVLFGEGEGMTSGSASGRVRWFLASLGAGQQNYMGQVVNRSEPGASATGGLASSVPSAAIANSNRPAGASPPLVAVPPRAASADSSGPNYPSTGAPPFDWRQFASRMGSTAATGGTTGGQSNSASDSTASSPPGKSAQPAAGAVPAEIGADPASPAEQVDWEDLVGHTPGQKVKTGLAAAAVLFVLYQLSRRIA